MKFGSRRHRAKPGRAAGFVTLTTIGRTTPHQAFRSGDESHGTPCVRRVTAELTKSSAGDEITLNVEGVVDSGVNRQKSLSRSSRFEPLHAPLPLPDRKMRVLGSIVLSKALGVLGRHTHRMQCRTVGWQPVGNDLIGRVSLLLQQSAHQLESRLLVSSGLHEDIENLTLAVDRPPQIHALAVDRDEDFIQVPAAITVAALSSQSIGKGQPELQCPSPDRLVRNVNPPSASNSSTSL
jgi:hypothetical protein